MDTNKFDRNTKQDGWNKMKIILDKEMPEKKRRVLPFFLIILLGGLVLISIYTYIGDKKETLYKNFSSGNKTIINENNIDTNHIINKNNLPDTLLQKRNNNTHKTNNTHKNHSKKNKTPLKKQLLDTPEIAINNKYFNSNNNTKTEDRKINNNRYLTIEKVVSKGLISVPLSQSMLVPNFDFNEYAISNKNQIKIFNPYLGIKIHTYNYKTFNPKFELNIANSFKFNNKISFEIGLALTQKRIIYQSLEINSYNLNSDSNSQYNKNNRLNIDEKIDNINKWVLELFLTEIYMFSNKAGFGLGGGLLLSNLNFNTKAYANYPNENNKQIVRYKNFNPVIFTDAALFYNLRKKVQLELGYKFYFSKTIYFQQLDSNISSLRLVNSHNSSRIYIGIKYYL